MKYYKRKIELFSTFILSCISFLGLSQTTPTQKFHDTKGNIEVTQAGQLQYTLPIDLPPGVKSTAPNISLVYGSGAGNGLAGYGWNISGITAISRAGKNLERDGIRKGIKLDYSDYYSFNGQRLILKSGEYGKDGAEYATEKYSNIKIKSVGTLAEDVHGPEYWEVTFEDGSKAWYGAAASGDSPARTPIDYNIVKTRDPQGNTITYEYLREGNVAVIAGIYWGGNENLNTPHFNEIRFAYNLRPIPETAYIEGVFFSQSKLLASITVSANSQQYKKYNVTYKQDLQQTGYRYLDKITVLNSKNEEANPVTFTYEKSMDLPNPNIKTWSKTSSLRPKEGEDLVGDFDGDGNIDLLRYHTTTSDKIPQIGLYMYSDLYNKPYDGIVPIYLGNTITKAAFNFPTAINLKKDNMIRNRQGFVTANVISSTTALTSDLELSFYSILEGGQLNLDYKRVIPASAYDFSVGTTQDGTRTTVVGLKNVDLNGDGLSELILQLNDRYCQLTSWDPSSKLPHECKNIKRYIVINPSEGMQADGWYYTINLYNSSEKDAFSDYRIGDFNGDGVFDFLKLDGNKKPLLITFQKDLQCKYTSSIAPYPVNAQPFNGLWEDGVVGDYNGDGLSDIMIPQSNDSDSWYLYTSKGDSFIESTASFEKPQKNRIVNNDPGIGIKILNPKVFVAYDINNDGKSELIRLYSGRVYSQEWPQDSNQGVKYSRTMASSVRVFSTFGGKDYLLASNQEPYPNATILYLNENNINQELAVNATDKVGLSVDLWSGAMLRKFVLVSMVPTVGYSYGVEQLMDYNSWYDISKEARIKSISQGGIVTDITYKQLDKKANPGLYDISQTENYPYVQVNQSVGMYVVSGLTQSTMSDKKLKQDFRYRGLTSNILGKGMIGFRKTARSSWYADGFENTKVWTGVEIDPTNEGVPVKEWSIRTNNEGNIFPADVSENNSQLLSFKSTGYQIDKLLNGQVVTAVAEADKARVVTAIVPKTSRGKDFLTGTLAESTMTYGEYYLPVQNISKINSGYSVKTTAFEYQNNPAGTGADYYIGRLKSKTETVQAYNDTKSGKEEYTYENNNLKTVKKWNTDNTGYLLHTYTYDGFGNVIQKVTANSVDSQTETSKTEYDAKGRFVMKKTDNLGLSTQITYNDWGQVLTQIDPLGNTLTNTYDEWGKLLTSKTNVTGTVTYLYDRDSSANTKVTENKPDGDTSTTFTNKLGQQYKISAKASGEGQFISKETQYDILGRKVKESEPYFEGQGAGKWNVMEYDDSVFPAKVKVTAFTGKQTETMVSGLKTTVTELNGNGRVTSKTVDALGNIMSSTDKGGTIEFYYNASGDQTQARYGDNDVTTKYDAWGRKSEFNDPSNGIYRYEYTGFGLPKKTKSPKGTKEYVYNALGQLVSQKEFSSIDNGETTDKNISFTYNDKGLLTGRSGTVNAQPFSVALAYDPQGRLVSSTENSNGRIYTEKGITFNDKGKVVSFQKELQSGGILTKVTIENVYNTWNGELYQIKDKNTGSILWELKQANAKGQVLNARLGGTEVMNEYDASGFLKDILHTSQAGPQILQVSYVFDAIKNELKSRTTGGDFAITESFDYDDNNRLINWTDPVAGTKPSENRNIYDVQGRITENDEIGIMKFDNPAKVYQPTGMTLNAAGAQNYDGDLIQNILYNENNDPVSIRGEKATISFGYGLTGMRQMVQVEKLPKKGFALIGKAAADAPFGGNDTPLWQTAFTKFYSEDGSFEVTMDPSTGQEKHILYIEGRPYESNIIYLKNFGEETGSYKFLHKDYIGSILAISDEQGNKLEQRHYDAWGNFTHLKLGDEPVSTDKAFIKGASLLVDRGYTGHEHFMDVGIIHMNGRLYDPLLRRFLNADENIQDPTNTQNYNKYGYVLNNPLMYNDPNGEFLMWLFGALAGGYLNGVAANGGQWNPGKWDWERTWSAVLGGAIGGAAVSGAMGNIASNGGAIKSFLPGLVSGGLNSAFSGGNFLGGAIGGISYTANVFENRMTSTDITTLNYKYSASINYEYSFDTESISFNDIKSKYPRYYIVLAKLHSFVSGNNIISQAFMDNSGASREEMLKLLNMENIQELPIKIDIIESVFHSGNGKDYKDKWNVGGKTSAYSPFNITINKLRVMTLERLTTQAAINAYSFALGITTLHELVHYVRFKKGLDNYNYEYGNAFEKRATGIFWPYDENLYKTNMHGWKF